MTQTRFIGYIHSIVGHVIMVSAKGDPALQEKCYMDDFESIMPVRDEGGMTVKFSFNVKQDRIPSMPYHTWLGNERRETDRLNELSSQLANITGTIQSIAFSLQNGKKSNQPSKEEAELSGLMGLMYPEQIDDPNLPSAAEFAAKHGAEYPLSQVSDPFDESTRTFADKFFGKKTD